MHFGRTSPLFLASDAACSFIAYWFTVQYPDRTGKSVGEKNNNFPLSDLIDRLH